VASPWCGQEWRCCYGEKQQVANTYLCFFNMSRKHLFFSNRSLMNSSDLYFVGFHDF
jgi:hypothetical protein